MMTAAQQKVFKHDLVAGLAADVARSKAVKSVMTKMAYRDPSGVDIGNLILHEFERYAAGAKPIALMRVRKVLERSVTPKAVATLVREYHEGRLAPVVGFGGFFESLLTSVIDAGAKIGESIIGQNTQEELQRMKDKAAVAAAAAQQQTAIAIATQQARAAVGAPSGMPDWLLPVGIGVGVLGIAYIALSR